MISRRSWLAAAAILMGIVASGAADSGQPLRPFDPEKDLLSLHYDHAPDKDDGHSAAADRSVLETLYGSKGVVRRVLPVSGAYGVNKPAFNPASDRVMDAVWHHRSAWLSAHDDWAGTVKAVSLSWKATLDQGGHVYVKEGGQSDLTAEVVKNLRAQDPPWDTRKRIHVVQHSDWNEAKTTPAALAYTHKHTHYVRIRDANRYLNRKGGDAAFEQAARTHPVFGSAWQAAFAYYPPRRRLDFSDTGELLHILGLGEMSIEAFRQRFLEPSASPSR